MGPLFAVRGTLCHAPEFDSFEILRDKVVVVNTVSGKIERIDDGARASAVARELGVAVRSLPDTSFFLPGFVDCHLHAPQYAFSGTATDRPLMQWLEHYTFPSERRMQDHQRALQIYRPLVRRLLRCGTTTAVFFASIHLAASCSLADTCHKYGQRAFIGKVSMDRNAPDGYRTTTAQDVADVKQLLLHVENLGSSRLQVAITPRFVPTCSAELMAALGELAAEHGLLIQSHISESMDEVDFTASLHPEQPRDLDLLGAAGLITSKAIMAHGTLLTHRELTRLACAGTAIVHCPLSNLFFGDAHFRDCTGPRAAAVCPLQAAAWDCIGMAVGTSVRHALRSGVRVCLGTDVAGGYSPSMLNAMRAAVCTARCCRIDALHHRSHDTSAATSQPASPQPQPASSGDADRHSYTYKEALHLATMAGASALHLQDKIGSFAVGKEWDALLIDATCGPFDLFDTDTLDDMVQKFLNLGDDRNITEVYVQGRLLSLDSD